MLRHYVASSHAGRSACGWSVGNLLPVAYTTQQALVTCQECRVLMPRCEHPRSALVVESPAFQRPQREHVGFSCLTCGASGSLPFSAFKLPEVP